jgi:hypothetical protein
MERLQDRLESIMGSDDSPAPRAAAVPRKKRRMSAAGRARIAAAARARWAQFRSGKTSKPVKKKRKVSAALKARLAAIARQRWKKAKAEGKSRL